MRRTNRRTWLGLALAGLAMVVPGCATKQKKAENTGFMSAEAQYRKGMDYLAADKLNLSRTTLQRIQYGADDDRSRIEPLARIALADATFYQGNDLSWIDAMHTEPLSKRIRASRLPSTSVMISRPVFSFM